MPKQHRRVSEMQGRASHYDEWLREYSGAGQNQQPYPQHKPQRVETRLSAAAPEMLDPEQYAVPGEKKSPWGWMKKSRGMYSPVSVHESGMAQQGQPMPMYNEKRRSWFRGSPKPLSKHEEYVREREALAS